LQVKVHHCTGINGKFAAVSTTLVANMPPAALFATSTAGFVNTGGKFATSVNDTSGKFAATISDIGTK
jgi:hypothetical protein